MRFDRRTVELADAASRHAERNTHHPRFRDAAALSASRARAPTVRAVSRASSACGSPKGDAARGMLQHGPGSHRDRDRLASLRPARRCRCRGIKVTLYKVDWRWWWDRAERVVGATSSRRGRPAPWISEAVVATNSRRARRSGSCAMNYPQWGRYLLRACDEDGGHCARAAPSTSTGRTWAGKEREQSGPAATMLSAHRPTSRPTRVGETATSSSCRRARRGRALVTVENGSGIVEARWLEPRAGKDTRVQHCRSLPAMTPNVYVAVTLMQPHEGKKNDRPIRLYGVRALGGVGRCRRTSSRSIHGGLRNGGRGHENTLRRSAKPAARQ